MPIVLVVDDSEVDRKLVAGLIKKDIDWIVEFASEQRRTGVGIGDAAVNAARLRFRAILMTAFSSILGFLPLLFASGAGAASRQAVGNAVVGGMIAATFFSLLFVPNFFVVFQSLGEKFGTAEAGEPADRGAKPPPKRRTRSESYTVGTGSQKRSLPALA